MMARNVDSECAGSDVAAEMKAGGWGGNEGRLPFLPMRGKSNSFQLTLL
jgi:hypothetical protein